MWDIITCPYSSMITASGTARLIWQVDMQFNNNDTRQISVPLQWHHNERDGVIS